MNLLTTAGAVNDSAREPIQAVDNYTADLSGADVGQEPLEPRAIKGFARLVLVVIPFAVPDPSIAKPGHDELQTHRKLGFTGGEIAGR
jgi:hypothetical protein